LTSPNLSRELFLFFITVFTVLDVVCSYSCISKLHFHYINLFRLLVWNPFIIMTLASLSRAASAAWMRATKENVPTEHHEVVIVGGGVAGLYTAYRLTTTNAESNVNDIVVLEGRPSVGGRVTTQRDADGNVMFNNFGWRVGEVNTEMIALAKELGIKLIPQVTPPEDKAKEGKGQCRHGPAGHVCSVTHQEREQYTVPEGRAPLSDFATASLISAKQADRQDRE
jgi:NAD(P)-binding Rossmann-like domain